MSNKNFDDAIAEVESETEQVYSHVESAAQAFLDSGEAYPRPEAKAFLSDELGVSKTISDQILTELVSDLVDPIVQIPSSPPTVGAIEYVEREGWYGYQEYDDITGRVRRGVCAQCIHEADVDSNVSYADRDVKTDWSDIGDVIHEHYENAHDVIPEDVEIGASLLSGTTVGGNTAIHNGNVSTVSVTDVDTSSFDNRFYINDGTDELIAETRTNDPSSPQDGRIWIRTDL